MIRHELLKAIRAADEIRNVCYGKKTLQVIIHKKVSKFSSSLN